MTDQLMTTYLYLKGWRRLTEHNEFSGQLVAHEDMQSDTVMGYMSYIQFKEMYIYNHCMVGEDQTGICYRLYYNQEMRGYKQ